MKLVAFMIFCFAALLQVQDAASWRFLPIDEPVNPRIIRDRLISTTFVCQADTPLTKCQVMVYVPSSHPYATVNSLVDLSRGSNSGVISRSSFYRNSFSVTYNGTGLEHGQCGATIVVVEREWNLYSCRGADVAGEWQAMDFVVRNPYDGDLASSINPRHMVAMPGENISVLFIVSVPLAFCGVHVNSIQPHSEHVRYYRANMSRGECGITLNITDIYNGPLKMTGIAFELKLVERRATLIVASPPTETNFNVDKLKYSVGDTLNATCSSLLSRPVANLTWTLDDRIIRQDGIDIEFQEDVWSWPWDKKNFTQRMSITLEEEHFGKKLECGVQHLAMTNQQSKHNYLITKI